MCRTPGVHLHCMRFHEAHQFSMIFRAMGRVNLSVTQDSWLSEHDEEPVSGIGCSAPLCFLSMSRAFTSTQEEDIGIPSEVLVRVKYDVATVKDVEKIQSVQARLPRTVEVSKMPRPGGGDVILLLTQK